MGILQVFVSFALLASLIAIFKPYGPIKNRTQAVVLFFGLCIFNAVVITISPKSKDSPNDQPSSTDSAKASSSINTDPPPSNWSYSSSTDEMSGVISQVACTKSINELNFNFPYSGGSSGSFCFRRKGKQLNAWVTISSGQFLCGIEECSLHLKFDDGPIQTFGAVESTTHESNMLFIRSEARLLSSVKKNERLKLQAEFFQEGSQVLQFDIAGLDTSKLIG